MLPFGKSFVADVAEVGLVGGGVGRLQVGRRFVLDDGGCLAERVTLGLRLDRGAASLNHTRGGQLHNKSII